MKQTAVEWLLENSHIVPKNELNKRKLIEQAKEMEKQQIIDAQENGQSIFSDVIFLNKSIQYYYETFNKREIPNIKNEFLAKIK